MDMRSTLHTAYTPHVYTPRIDHAEPHVRAGHSRLSRFRHYAFQGRGELRDQPSPTRGRQTRPGLWGRRRCLLLRFPRRGRGRSPPPRNRSRPTRQPARLRERPPRVVFRHGSPRFRAAEARAAPARPRASRAYPSADTLLRMATFHPSRSSVEMGRMRSPGQYVLIVTSAKERIGSPLS
jgi:hypothetical protein